MPMTDSDARPEPIIIAEFEGEYVRTMVGSLPAIALPMDVGYQRNTHLKMELELRVRNVRYEELTKAEEKATGDVGGMKRVHVFVLEEARIVEALTADQADEGVGGSAGGGQLRIEERFEYDGGARECFYDTVQLAVVHRGGCELCESETLAPAGPHPCEPPGGFGLASADGAPSLVTADPGF